MKGFIYEESPTPLFSITPTIMAIKTPIKCLGNHMLHGFLEAHFFSELAS